MVVGIFKVLGALGVFLFGMRIMSDALQKTAGEKLKNLLNVLTKNRFTSVLTGVVITGIIQSSSATTVILVSLVNAGLLELTKAIGVIMGANIGTTATAWIVSLLGFSINITDFAMPAIGLALPFLFSKYEKRRNWGEILIGFGLLFMGIDMLKNAVPNIQNNVSALSFLQHLTSYGYGSVFLFILVGTVLTIIIQSSSAAMAITITMAYKGWIPFSMAAALVLGENIGTTITAYLASLGMNLNARRAARSHMLFNLTGVVWMCFLFYPCLALVDWMVPGAVTDPASLPLHLSAFHSFFNIVNTSLMVWFIPQFAKAVEFLVPEKPSDRDTTYKLNFVNINFPDFAEANLQLARRELGKYSALTNDMLLFFLNSMEKKPKELEKTAEVVQNHWNLSEKMYEEISKFLASCRSSVTDDRQGSQINSMLIMVSELRSIATGCQSLVEILKKKDRKKIKFHKNGETEIAAYTEEVLDFMRYNTNYINSALQVHDIELAQRMETAINAKRDRLRKTSQNKMEKGGDIQGELLYMDMIKHLEHLGDFSLNIAQSMRALEVVKA